MSTTTNFKRIALVAVAALGLGVLSSVPSQATINADLLTLSSTTATQTTAETYTATSSATATLSFFGAAADSVSVTAALISAPTGNLALPVLRLIETSNATVDSSTGAARALDSAILANNASKVAAISGTVGTSAKYAIYLALSGSDTDTAGLKAGTYTVKLTPAALGVGTLVGATAQTLSITVSTAASASTTPDPATSKLYIQASGSNVVPSTDSSVVVSKEIGTSSVGYVYFSLLNAASGSVSESVTAEISGPGTLGVGSSTLSAGRSISVKNTETVTIWSDGVAGKSTITIKGSTSGVTIGSKTVTFYGPTATFTAAVGKAILAPGVSNSKAVTFTAKDSAGNVLNDEYSAAGTPQVWYAFSSDTSVATIDTLNYANDSGTVSVNGIKAGTTTVTIGNAATLAASTIKSSPVTLRVGSTSVSSVKVAFDKATYAPGEKAVITLSLLDATGLPVAPTTAKYEIWEAASELASDISFTNSTTITTETSVALASTTVAGVSTAGAKTYVVYMPAVGGKVTLTGTLASQTATGAAAPAGTLLTVAAIQGTSVTTSATVTDSGSAALAAVTALATTVASLKTLIVTLTNLVLKIQKKVKA